VTSVVFISPATSFVTENGESKTLSLHEKWSSTILRELMDTAGGTAWETWKAERLVAGEPIVEGEEKHKEAEKLLRRRPVPPSLEEWTVKKEMEAKAKEERKIEEERKREEAEEVELMPERPRPRTGAAAVLP
jgi:small subunit ribosomal protein S25